MNIGFSHRMGNNKIRARLSEHKGFRGSTILTYATSKGHTDPTNSPIVQLRSKNSGTSRISSVFVIIL